VLCPNWLEALEPLDNWFGIQGLDSPTSELVYLRP
jgi:hypothetical protein